MFFALQPKLAYLSDANSHLIQTYVAIRDHPTQVILHLRELIKADSEAFYYRIREEYNSSKTSAKQAARFIFLNRTCFNGIFRVNRQGKFNVPYGYKESPIFPDVEQLEAVSNALTNARLQSCDYLNALEDAAKGDFVYLDPPYPPLNGTSNFSHYTKDRFSDDDQEELAELIATLDKIDCKVMISNANTPQIRKLYKGFKMSALDVTRFVSCKSKRHKVSELVITNY